MTDHFTLNHQHKQTPLLNGHHTRMALGWLMKLKTKAFTTRMALGWCTRMVHVLAYMYQFYVRIDVIELYVSILRTIRCRRTICINATYISLSSTNYMYQSYVRIAVVELYVSILRTNRRRQIYVSIIRTYRCHRTICINPTYESLSSNYMYQIYVRIAVVELHVSI